jgi:hypothetical protein
MHGCGGTAGKVPGWCPQRVLLNGEDGDTKSRAGRRAIGLSDQLAQLLREHKTEQERMRKHASCGRTGAGYTTATGRPLNLNSDYHRWKALLKVAGVRDRPAPCPAHRSNGPPGPGRA